MKPKVKLIGEDGNIFNLMYIANRELERNDLREEAKNMIKEVEKSEGYRDALKIITKYVEVR